MEGKQGALFVESPYLNFFIDLENTSTLSDKEAELFREMVWSYYQHHRRSFSWREEITPYRVVVSEIMLQQTQTDRVKPKFEAFVAQFDSFALLAQATQREVLQMWQGLGYNRRGLALHKIAQRVMHEHEGALPNEPAALVNFSGIGPNTAASICAFAFNKPVTFIETNIRTVFLHVFFRDQDGIHDKALMPLIEQALDLHNPREWYYALMDYGVFLKKHFKNPSRRSRHHTKQSKFEGSDRQIRGAIVKLLIHHESLSFDALQKNLGRNHLKIKSILEDLVQEGFIKLSSGNTYYM